MFSSPLALLQMQLKAGFDAIEPGQAPLGEAPERLDTIDMIAAPPDKLAGPVMNAEVPGIANIHQAIVAPTTIAVDHTLHRNLPSITACNVALRQSGTI